MPEEASCPVVTRVHEAARRHAMRPAVVFAGHSLSYAGLWERVSAWRERLEALRIPARSLVCIVSDGCLELPAALLGARAAGLVPMLVDAAHGTGAVPGARPAANIYVADGRVELTGDGRTIPEETGYVVFSSGSTGTPKGIAGQALGLAHFIDWEIGRLGLHPGARTAMLTSPAFDVVYRDLLVPLCGGAELHIPPARVRLSASRILPWLAEHDIALVHLVPSLASRWAAPGIQLPNLRWSLFAGEPLYSRHVERWRAVAPASRVFNLYGPSETTLAKFAYEVPHAAHPGLQPVGQPLPGTRVYLETVGSGHRVVIETADGSLGYLDGTCTPEDAGRLRRNGQVTRFETQDRGFLDDDGNLVIAGRLDSLVKRFGSFVDLARLEAAAADLPGVRAACCVQLPDSGRIILAVEGPGQQSAAGVWRCLKPRLGNQRPDEVMFMDALPLLVGGKVDRRAISARYREMAGHG